MNLPEGPELPRTPDDAGDAGGGDGGALISALLGALKDKTVDPDKVNVLLQQYVEAQSRWPRADILRTIEQACPGGTERVLEIVRLAEENSGREVDNNRMTEQELIRMVDASNRRSQLGVLLLVPLLAGSAIALLLFGERMGVSEASALTVSLALLGAPVFMVLAALVRSFQQHRSRNGEE